MRKKPENSKDTVIQNWRIPGILSTIYHDPPEIHNFNYNEAIQTSMLNIFLFLQIV